MLDESCIYIYAKRYGYAWAFPLGNNIWHIGAGAFTKHQTQFLFDQLIKILNLKDKIVKMCSCSSFVNWFSCYEVSFVKDNIVAIGEAGGFVSALGEGNTLALESAYLLFECIKQADSPQQAISMFKKKALKHFRWLKYQYAFIKALNKNKLLALLLLPLVVKVAKKRTLEIKLSLKLLRLVKSL